MSLSVTTRLHRGTHSKPQPHHIELEFCHRCEGSIITDEMNRGINKPVPVLQTIEIPAVHESLHGTFRTWLL